MLMNAKTDGARRVMTEEIQVAGHELIDRVKALLNEGRVRHIKVKGPNGETYFELPLAMGVLGGAALAFASPFLAMAGALAGMVTNFKIEIVRDTDIVDAIEDATKAAAEKAWDAATKARRAAARAVKGATSTAKRVAAKAPSSVKRVAAKAPSRAVATTKRSPGKTSKAGKAAAKTARGKTKTTGRR